jgi:hypothetical protein
LKTPGVLPGDNHLKNHPPVPKIIAILAVPNKATGSRPRHVQRRNLSENHLSDQHSLTGSYAVSARLAEVLRPL